MKYYEDGTWIDELNYENRIIELVVEGTSDGLKSDYKDVLEDVLENLSKYTKMALERLFVWEKSENILKLSKIYCGKLYYGFGTEPIEKGFAFSFNDEDLHTIHTVIFSEYKTPSAYLMSFE